MSRYARRIRRFAKAKKRAEEVAARPVRPRSRVGRAIDAAFLSLPVPVRNVIVRARVAWMRWAYQPRVPPELVGKVERTAYPPARVLVRFNLHPDGTVTYVDRFTGQQLLVERDVADIVIHEYNQLVAYARQHGAAGPGR